jgi:hypothetical protein
VLFSPDGLRGWWAGGAARLRAAAARGRLDRRFDTGEA